ncbi:RNA polymerase sigma factor [Streptomyces sp. SLBN-8D4]|uniref:RNA polymerase sigma factor n=1 Tax=Streptomyces sp. SLBN-8D4 TaxID=3377728 RepID=UPI003C7E5AAE
MTSQEHQAEGRTDPRAAFYRAHHSQLVGFIRRRIKHADEAEPLAHDTWLAFLGRFETYRHYDNPAGPLFVIARRKISDWFAKQNIMDQLPGDDLGEYLTRMAQNMPDMIGQVGMRIDLARAVTRLTPRQREALMLYYVDGLPRPAVAQLMGISVDGVKKLIATAVKELRKGQTLDSYLPAMTSASRTRKEVRK